MSGLKVIKNIFKSLRIVGVVGILSFTVRFTIGFTVRFALFHVVFTIISKKHLLLLYFNKIKDKTLYFNKLKINLL